MTEFAKRYHLRLLERFVFYDPDHGAHLFRDWARGAIISDPTEIAFLELRDAPVERVPLNLKN